MPDIFQKGEPCWVLRSLTHTLLNGLQADMANHQEEGLDGDVCDRLQPILKDFEVVASERAAAAGRIGYAFRRIGEGAQAMFENYYAWNDHPNDRAYAPQRESGLASFRKTRKVVDVCIVKQKKVFLQYFDFEALKQIFLTDFRELFGPLNHGGSEADISEVQLRARSCLPNLFRLYKKNHQTFHEALKRI